MFLMLMLARTVMSSVTAVQVESLRDKKTIAPLSPALLRQSGGRSSSAPRMNSVDVPAPAAASPSHSRGDQLSQRVQIKSRTEAGAASGAYDVAGSSDRSAPVLAPSERLQLITGRLDGLGLEISRKTCCFMLEPLFCLAFGCLLSPAMPQAWQAPWNVSKRAQYANHHHSKHPFRLRRPPFIIAVRQARRPRSQQPCARCAAQGAAL